MLEPGVLVFHPEHLFLGANVYVGHQAILKAYYQNELRIGDGTWIGQACFIHGAGGVTIGRNVGVGPHVCIISSMHCEQGRSVPILHSAIEFAPVVIEEGADLGVGSTLLPGVTVGSGAQVGAGAVVTRDVPPYAVVAGNPARLLRFRDE